MDLYDLAELSGDGFTSLQPDHHFLQTYINSSLDSFETPSVSKPQKFLLGLEHLPSGKVVGCAAVKTKIGQSTPFINFQMKNAHGQDIADIKTANHLHPSTRFRGATEVGSLFLHPDHRGGGIGRYLASSRYQLIATAPHIFGSVIIAELRGVLDIQGECPFYNYVLKDHFGYSFSQADKRLASSDANILQRIKVTPNISISSLPPHIQKTIGQPHKTGIGAYKLLQQEGFEDTGCIDLFDCGPIVAAKTDNLRQLNTSRALSVNTEKFDAPEYTGLISTRRLQSFRAIISSARPKGNSLSLPPSSLKALHIHLGDTVTIGHSS